MSGGHTQTPTNPVWPQVFYSEWVWYESFVDGPRNEGNCIWAKNNQNRMYLNLEPIGKEQLVIDNAFYEWNTRFPHNCRATIVNYSLVDHWFDNTTFSGYAMYYNQSGNPQQTVAMFIGSLNLNGFLSNYMVYSAINNGWFGYTYIAINIYRDAQSRPGSELNDLKYMQYLIPDGAEHLFILPPFCQSMIKNIVANATKS